MSDGANDGQGQHNSHGSLIRRVAESQGGHISRGQLHDLGLNRNQIAHLIRRRQLIRVLRGVYAVGRLPGQPLDQAHAALLVIGGRSALGHDSAGSFWHLFRSWRQPFHVVTPLDRRPAGVVVHHCATLTRGDIHTDPATNLRVTSAARTVLDLTPRFSDRRVRRFVNGLRFDHGVSRSELRDVLAANPRHPGAGRLAVILLGSQRNPGRSDLEEAFLEIVRRYGLPMPELNVHVQGERVDFLFREHGLIVEVDGPVTHAEDPWQWAEDRRRDREILIATGISTIRFTYDDCLDTPEQVAATVRRALDARSAPARGRASQTAGPRSRESSRRPQALARVRPPARTPRAG